jgi:hypothetical protein
MRCFFPAVLMAAMVTIPASQAAAQEIDFVIVEIRTGGDDLRGKNDNAFASVWSYRSDGRQRGIRQQVNRANKRIRDYTSATISFRMPEGTEVDDVTNFSIDVEGFTGGFDGDNWNVDAIRVTATRRGVTVREYINEHASPLIRFTGDNKHFYRDLRVR